MKMIKFTDHSSLFPGIMLGVLMLVLLAIPGVSTVKANPAEAATKTFYVS